MVQTLMLMFFSQYLWLVLFICDFMLQQNCIQLPNTSAAIWWALMELILILSSLSALKYLPVHHNLFSVQHFVQDILKICSMFF